MTPEEIDTLINSFDASRPLGQRDKAMVELIYSCGLTVSELLNVKIGDIDFEQGTLRIPGKKDSFRVIPVLPQALEEIKKYISENRNVNPKKHTDILFVGKGGKQLGRIMIFNIIKKADSKSGINKNTGPQTIRNSFAAHLIQGGADLRIVQEILGHKSIFSTEIYSRAK